MKKQGSAGIVVLIIAVVILALAVVGMGVYIFTSNMIVSEDIGNEKIEQSVVEESIQENVKEETTNKFSLYAKNIKAAYEKLFANDGMIIWTEYTGVTPGLISNIKLDQNYDAYMVVDRNSKLGQKYNNTEIKIDSNVMSVYYCISGNGGFGNIILVHFDGTVSIVSDFELYQTGEIKLEKVNGLKDITGVVRVAGMGATGYYYIDINGNLYKRTGELVK